MVRKNLYVSLFHHPLMSFLGFTEEAQSQSWNYNSEVKDQRCPKQDQTGRSIWSTSQQLETYLDKLVNKTKQKQNTSLQSIFLMNCHKSFLGEKDS